MAAYASIYNARCENKACVSRFTSQRILDVIVDVASRRAYFVTECTRCGTENHVAVGELSTAYRMIPDLRGRAPQIRSK